MKRHWMLRSLSLAVAIVCAVAAPSGASPAEGMCNSGGTECGICCYGSTYEQLAPCCQDNGCGGTCELTTNNMCCPGGYQISGCET